MKAYLFPLLCGLLLGLTLHWTGFSRPHALRDALALRRSPALRSALYALGASMMLTALLCWLAVIDVDGIVVLPLDAGVLLGGLIFGAAAGLCGFTPLSAFSGAGSVHALEALCTLLGALAVTWLLPVLDAPLIALHGVGGSLDATLFRVTLDEPFLLGGGFLGQGLTGVLLMVIAGCIPSRRMAPAAAEVRAEDAPPAEDLPPAEDAPEDTFVAVLPGEEPLVIDTQMDEDDESSEAQEESAEDAAEGTDKDAINSAQIEENVANYDQFLPDLDTDLPENEKDGTILSPKNSGDDA